MNYDLVPVVGSLSFLYVPRIYHTHTYDLILLYLYIYIYVQYTQIAARTKRDLRNTLWRKKTPPRSAGTMDAFVFTPKPFSTLIIPLCGCTYSVCTTNRLYYAIGF